MPVAREVRILPALQPAVKLRQVVVELLELLLHLRRACRDLPRLREGRTPRRFHFLAKPFELRFHLVQVFSPTVNDLRHMLVGQVGEDGVQPLDQRSGAREVPRLRERVGLLEYLGLLGVQLQQRGAPSAHRFEMLDHLRVQGAITVGELASRGALRLQQRRLRPRQLAEGNQVGRDVHAVFLHG